MSKKITKKELDKLYSDLFLKCSALENNIDQKVDYIYKEIIKEEKNSFKSN
jgi:hypothetical protein